MPTLQSKRCLQPKEIEDIFSMGFLLIPLVVPYDQLLIYVYPRCRRHANRFDV